MRIAPKKLIEDFIDMNAEKYGDIHPDVIRHVIRCFFGYLRIQITSDKLPLIGIKYFGKFMVFPGTLINKLLRYYMKFKQGSMSIHYLNEGTKHLIKYYEDNPERFEVFFKNKSNSRKVIKDKKYVDSLIRSIKDIVNEGI